MNCDRANPAARFPAGRLFDFLLGAPVARNGAADQLEPQPPTRELPNAPKTSPRSSLIYAVDDVPRVTELYAMLLGPEGYEVKTFNHRLKALIALSQAEVPPALLITDYLGFTMPINQFLKACRVLYPNLPILMASGFEVQEMRFTGFKPDFHLRKPFTAEELSEAVKTALQSDSKSWVEST